MTADYPVDRAQATPEYVLELLCDLHRFGVLDAPPTFDTPIRELANNLNDTILFWQELARSLDTDLGLDVPRADWKHVLCPMAERTVRDVCEFVAARLGTRPVVRPWRYVGGECVPAGWFLTLRSKLVEDGADPAGITPLAELDRFVLVHRHWLAATARMAPGSLPLVSFRYRPWWVRFPAAVFVGLPALFAALLGVGGVILGVVNGTASVVAAGAGIAAAGVLGVWGVARLGQPIGATLEGCRTFRDLAYRLAGQEPRRRIQTTP